MPRYIFLSDCIVSATLDISNLIKLSLKKDAIYDKLQNELGEYLEFLTLSKGCPW